VPENAGSVTLTVQRSGGTGPSATASAANPAPGATVPSGSVRPNPSGGPERRRPGPSSPAPSAPSRSASRRPTRRPRPARTTQL
jgi:hypothetical protein